MHAILAFNLLMLVADLAVLAVLRFWPRISTWLAGLGLAALIATALGSHIPVGRYGISALAACGIFLHGASLLAVSAFFLRRARPKTAILSAAAAAVLWAVAIDAFLIEPVWLEVSYVRVTSPKLAKPVRIVVLADLQTDQLGAYEKRVLRRVLTEEPDLILLAGDYVQVDGERRPHVQKAINAFLHEIDFRGAEGAFAVRGNIDQPGWTDIFADLPVTVNHRTRTTEVAGLRLTCLCTHDAFNARLKLTTPDPDRFHLVLGHAPDCALGHIEADLLVAGHTHGGQVRLPWIGPLFYPSPVPRDWAAGVTHLPGGTTLLVSRGIGLERDAAPRLRFLCRPELVVIDLLPEK